MCVIPKIAVISPTRVTCHPIFNIQEFAIMHIQQHSETTPTNPYKLLRDNAPMLFGVAVPAVFAPELDQSDAIIDILWRNARFLIDLDQIRRNIRITLIHQI
eukprot:206233_1